MACQRRPNAHSPRPCAHHGYTVCKHSRKRDEMANGSFSNDEMGTYVIRVISEEEPKKKKNCCAECRRSRGN
eukprot:611124-Prymnesium_polylepis.1